MRSAELEKQIAALEEQRAVLVERIDKIVLDSQPEIIELAAAWIDGEVRGRIAAHAAKVQSLEASGVAKLKAAVTAVKGQLPVIVAATFGNSEKWMHRKLPKTTNGGSWFPRPLEEGPAALFKETIAPLGRVLHHFGLDGPTTSGGFRHWHRVDANQFEYTLSTGFDPAKTRSLASYWKPVEELNQVEVELDRVRAQLASVKAIELYEST